MYAKDGRLRYCYNLLGIRQFYTEGERALPSGRHQVRMKFHYDGGIVSFDLKGGKKAAFNFLRSLKIARNAVSLGGVESLVCHPKTTTHSGMTAQELAESGVTDGLVRVSVGIEDWRDLLSDFKQALEASI